MCENPSRILVGRGSADSRATRAMHSPWRHPAGLLAKMHSPWRPTGLLATRIASLPLVARFLAKRTTFSPLAVQRAAEKKIEKKAYRGWPSTRNS